MEANLEVECEGKYRGGSKDYFDHIFGNFLPGEGERIMNFKVYLIMPPRKGLMGQSQRLDITWYLEESEYKELYDKYLDECREG